MLAFIHVFFHFAFIALGFLFISSMLGDESLHDLLDTFEWAMRYVATEMSAFWTQMLTLTQHIRFQFLSHNTFLVDTPLCTVNCRGHCTYTRRYELFKACLNGDA